MGRTVVSTYAFPDADGTHPAAFTDLSGGSGQVRCITNKFHNGFSALDSDSVITAGTYNDDQYAKVTVSGISGGANGDRIGVSIRCTTAANPNGFRYRAYVTDNAPVTLTLQKIVNGTATSLGVVTTLPWANGDTVYIECFGSTIIAGRNDTPAITVTDTAIPTGGKGGIYAFVGSGDVLRGDDFEAGNSARNIADQRTTTNLTFTGLPLDQLEDDEDDSTISPWALSGWYDLGLSLNRWYDEDFAASTSPDVTIGLTGQLATFTPGTLSPAIDKALTGQSATFATGTVVANPALALTGQRATFTPGTLLPSTSVALTGIAATFTPGILTPNIDVLLLGQLAVFTAGTVTASTSSDVTVALTGQAATFAAGTLIPTIDLPLIGQSAVFAAGTLVPNTAVALAGQVANFASGTLAPSITLALTGISAAFTPGTMTAQVGGDITVALTGIQATFVAGILTPSGADVVSTEAPSGGWEKRRWFYTAYERELKRRIAEEERRRELEAELEDIEEPVTREIATIIHQQDAIAAERADLERLRLLVAQYGREELSDLTPRVMSAFTRAFAQQNFSALQALDRELKRQMEEEEVAVLLILLNDD